MPNNTGKIMTWEQTKFRQISAKLVGSNIVNFRLEDETLVKVHIELARVGVAVDRKNPDGTPIYNINANLRMDFETKDKTFYAPIPQCQKKAQATKRHTQLIRLETSNNNARCLRFNVTPDHETQAQDLWRCQSPLMNATVFSYSL